MGLQRNFYFAFVDMEITFDRVLLANGVVGDAKVAVS